MKRIASWFAAGVVVVGLVVGLVWQLHSDGKISYHRSSVAVASYESASSDARALVLSTAMLAGGDKDVTARVVSESSSRVVVAMSYQRFECNGCARTAEGFIVPVPVHLRAPLAGRTVVDRLTGRPVKYATRP